MAGRIQQLEILNEVLMAIGQSLDREHMLRGCLPVMVRRLGCTCAVIVEWQGQGGWVLSHSLPRRIDKKAVLAGLPEPYEGSGSQEGKVWQAGARYYHAWQLPNEGWLVLGRGRPFDHLLRHELGGVARHLGLALVACEQYRELQRARRAADQEAELHRVTLQALAEALISIDGDGVVRRLNPAAERMLGSSADRLLGRPLAELIRLYPANPGEMLEAGLTGEPIDLRGKGTGEAFLQRPGAGPLPVHYTIAAIPDGAEGWRGMVVTLADRSERQRLEEQMSWQALHDALTGLPNRRLLSDRLNRAVAMADRYEKMLAVALVDLDGFKPVNDRFGHEVGDALLRAVARRMRDMLRSGDTLARLGGDEFVIVMEEIRSMTETGEILQRLLHALAQPFEVEGHRVVISASLGYTLYPILDEGDTDTLLRHADQAMYRAKEQGRNRIYLFDALERERQEIRVRKVREIRDAIGQGQMVLHYQPKVSMQEGAVMGCEGLVRWQHPEHGLIPPAEFLPWLESGGQTAELGYHVLREAVRQAGLWRRQGLDWTVAVNISPDHFLSPVFLDELDEVLESEHPLSAGALELEIVESVAIGDLDHAISTIEACHSRGVRVAIDDFGVGYASLSYLKNLPADHIKIDRSFVRDMLHDRDDLVLIESIVTLAHLMERDVTAEGVENPEQGLLLMRLGCDWAQGFGIARPMPADAVGEWAREWRPDPAWSRWMGLDWSLDDIPLLLAQYDHRQWVERVLAVLKGEGLTLDRDELISPHECRLGRWYDTRGRRRYGRLRVFRELKPLHEEVHRVGRRLVNCVQEGDLGQARALGERLTRLRDEVVAQLDRLLEQVARSLADSGDIHSAS